MRIPTNYPKYHLHFRGVRLGVIHVALRRKQNPKNHLFIYYPPSKIADLHHWVQSLKRDYPEPEHARPT